MLVELIGNAGAFLKGFGGLALCGGELVDVLCERGNGLCHPAAAEFQVGQNGGELLDAARAVESFEELEEGGVAIGLQCAGKLFHIEAGGARHFGGFLVEGSEHVLKGRCAALHAHHALVEH